MHVSALQDTVRMMFDKIKSFIASIPPLMWIVSIIITFGIITTVLNGCNLESMVEVKVPPAVKTAINIPPNDFVSLEDADAAWTDWLAYVNSNTKKFESAIHTANERYAVIKQITDIGMASLNTAAPGIPGGTVLLSVASLLGGLFLKRPGEDARVASEKEASYNKGMEVAIELQNAVKTT